MVFKLALTGVIYQRGPPYADLNRRERGRRLADRASIMLIRHCNVKPAFEQACFC
jgi:hypothetical protein